METFEMWRYGRTQKIIRTDTVINGEVLRKKIIVDNYRKKGLNFFFISQNEVGAERAKIWFGVGKRSIRENNRCPKPVNEEWGYFWRATVLAHKETYLKDPMINNFYFIDKPEN